MIRCNFNYLDWLPLALHPSQVVLEPAPLPRVAVGGVAAPHGTTEVVELAPQILAPQHSSAHPGMYQSSLAGYW